MNATKKKLRAKTRQMKLRAKVTQLSIEWKRSFSFFFDRSFICFVFALSFFRLIHRIRKYKSGFCSQGVNWTTCFIKMVVFWSNIRWMIENSIRISCSALHRLIQHEFHFMKNVVSQCRNSYSLEYSKIVIDICDFWLIVV